MQKNDILRPVRKAVVESDAHGGPKCRSKICINNDESKIEWDTLSKERGSKNVASKIIVDSSLMYRLSAHTLTNYQQ